MEEAKNRFKSYIVIIGNCWKWIGHRDKDGYGIFFFSKKSRKAHRVSYYFKHGDIPHGMVIDHICKVRDCVNPDHLRCVTKRQNALENSNSLGAINAQKTHCKFGHPLDKKYGRQRYCSKCSNEKSKRLYKKNIVEANKIKC